MLGYRCTMTDTLKTDKQTKSIKVRDLPRHRTDQHAESRFYFYFLKYFFQHCYLCTATEIPFIYYFSGNCAASAPISTFTCLWVIYIFPGSVHIGRPIVGIYNSLTDTWMWKLGPGPWYSFSGNICYKFSAFCLCSVPQLRFYCIERCWNRTQECCSKTLFPLG